MQERSGSYRLGFFILVTWTGKKYKNKLYLTADFHSSILKYYL
jgi:hypothetical protein